jgi:hypothetical protein
MNSTTKFAVAAAVSMLLLSMTTGPATATTSTHASNQGKADERSQAKQLPIPPKPSSKDLIWLHEHPRGRIHIDGRTHTRTYIPEKTNISPSFPVGCIFSAVPPVTLTPTSNTMFGEAVIDTCSTPPPTHCVLIAFIYRFNADDSMTQVGQPNTKFSCSPGTNAEAHYTCVHQPDAQFQFVTIASLATQFVGNPPSFDELQSGDSRFFCF